MYKTNPILFMKSSTLKQIIALILVIVCFCLPTIEARHIVGGDVTYQFVSFNGDSTLVTYDIIFNIYRDSESGGAPFDNDARFGVYQQQADGSWEHIFTTDRLDFGPVDQIPVIDDPCRREPDDVGVQATFYDFRLTLEVSEFDYMVVYQRCCRNNNISNLVSPESTGAAFNVVISSAAQRLGNSSPVFEEYPPIFVCAGFPLDVDVSGSDIDGDFLRYSFCLPSAAGGRGGPGCDQSTAPNPNGCPPPYDSVVFRAPYTTEIPMGGDPVVSINPFTGLITGIPDIQGQFVLGMCIEEFRDGELIGSVSRDFQFNVLECTKELTASLKADGTEVGTANSANQLVNVIKACGDSTVFFENQSFGTQLRDFTWEIRDSLDDIIFTRFDVTQSNFSFDFPELGFYTGTLIANEGSECPDTAFFRIERLPEMRTEFEYDTSAMCYLGPIQFTDRTFAAQADVVEWNWDFDDEGRSDLQNPVFEFEDRGDKQVTLISMDTNGCIDTMDLIVNYNPPHDSILTENIELELCFGEQYDWYGDIITTDVMMDQVITYSETGCDSVNTRIVTRFSTEPQDVVVNPVLCPGEVFTYLGQDYSMPGEFVDFTRSLRFDCDSIFHFINLQFDTLPIIEFDSSYLFVEAFEDFRIPVSIDRPFAQASWSPPFGLDCTDCLSPTVNHNIDGLYTLELVTDVDCVTTRDVFLDFVAIPDQYYFPTVVSNNALGQLNDKFFVQTVDWAGEVLYDIDIYDRWGGLMHTRRDIPVNDPSQAWEVRDMTPGAYAYTITIKEFFETQFFSGTITVVK